MLGLGREGPASVGGGYRRALLSANTRATWLNSRLPCRRTVHDHLVAPSAGEVCIEKDHKDGHKLLERNGRYGGLLLLLVGMGVDRLWSWREAGEQRPCERVQVDDGDEKCWRRCRWPWTRLRHWGGRLRCHVRSTSRCLARATWLLYEGPNAIQQVVLDHQNAPTAAQADVTRDIYCVSYSATRRQLLSLHLWPRTDRPGILDGERSCMQH